MNEKDSDTEFKPGDNLPRIAEVLPEAASGEGKEVDEALVSEAFEYLKVVIGRHLHEAMLDVGQYLIQKFYNNDYDRAREGRKAKGESLRQLILKLQENSGNAPSKTWVYDSIKLAVDEHDFKNFRTYGKLGHSQKVLITHVKEDEKKRALIEEAAEKDYTVNQLRERIREERENNRKKRPKFDEIELDKEKVRELALDGANLKMISILINTDMRNNQSKREKLEKAIEQNHLERKILEKNLALVEEVSKEEN